MLCYEISAVLHPLFPRHGRGTLWDSRVSYEKTLIQDPARGYYTPLPALWFCYVIIVLYRVRIIEINKISRYPSTATCITEVVIG